MVYVMDNQSMEIGTIFENIINRDYNQNDNSIKLDQLGDTFDINYSSTDISRDSSCNQAEYLGESDSNSSNPIQEINDKTNNIMMYLSGGIIDKQDLEKDLNVNDGNPKLSATIVDSIIRQSINNNSFQGTFTEPSSNNKQKTDYETNNENGRVYYDKDIMPNGSDTNLKVDIEDFLSTEIKIENFHEINSPEKRNVKDHLLTNCNSFFPVDRDHGYTSSSEIPNMINETEMTKLRRQSKSVDNSTTQKNSNAYFNIHHHPLHQFHLKSQNLNDKLAYQSDNADIHRKKHILDKSTNRLRSKVLPKVQKPKKMKKSNNIIEKRYRSNINEKMTYLKEIVPTLRVACKREEGLPIMKKDSVDLDGLQPAIKLNKASILLKTIEYIRHLESKCKDLNNNNNRFMRKQE